MKHQVPSLHPSQTHALAHSASVMTTAKNVIFEQKSLLMSIRRSAWWLFQYELRRTDPDTGQLYTPYQALDNTLRWMAEQSEQLERVRREPTQTQKQILQMLVDGMTQKQIARELGINPRTIRVHFYKIRARFRVSTMYQVMAICVKKGWVQVKRTGNTSQRIRAIRQGRDGGSRFSSM